MVKNSEDMQEHEVLRTAAGAAAEVQSSSGHACSLAVCLNTSTARLMAGSCGSVEHTLATSWVLDLPHLQVRRCKVMSCFRKRVLSCFSWTVHVHCRGSSLPGCLKHGYLAQVKLDKWIACICSAAEQKPAGDSPEANTAGITALGGIQRDNSAA